MEKYDNPALAILNNLHCYKRQALAQMINYKHVLIGYSALGIDEIVATKYQFLMLDFVVVLFSVISEFLYLIYWYSFGLFCWHSVIRSISPVSMI